MCVWQWENAALCCKSALSGSRTRKTLCKYAVVVTDYWFMQFTRLQIECWRFWGCLLAHLTECFIPMFWLFWWKQKNMPKKSQKSSHQALLIWNVFSPLLYEVLFVITFFSLVIRSDFLLLFFGPIIILSQSPNSPSPSHFIKKAWMCLMGQGN